MSDHDDKCEGVSRCCCDCRYFLERAGKTIAALRINLAKVEEEAKNRADGEKSWRDEANLWCGRAQKAESAIEAERAKAARLEEALRLCGDPRMSNEKLKVFQSALNSSPFDWLRRKESEAAKEAVRAWREALRDLRGWMEDVSGRGRSWHEAVKRADALLALADKPFHEEVRICSCEHDAFQHADDGVGVCHGDWPDGSICNCKRMSALADKDAQEKREGGR